MADNVTLPGTGAVVATDDDGTAQHQYVKVEFGADGTFTKVSSSNPLPTVQTGAIPAGSNNIGDVDIASAIPAGSNEIGGVNQTKVSGTAVSVNSGAKDAGTQRVILASDQTVIPISDNAGSLTVDAPVTTPVFVRLSDGTTAIATLPVSLASLPALAAGSAAIGKLTANGGVIIGDVNLVSAVPAGTNLIGQVTPTPGTAGGWSKIKYAAQTTTVVKPKGTAGTFGGYFAYNPNASVAYIQVFDLATATTVTLGTTVPDMIFAIPAASAANLEITLGVNMALGMQLACTTTALGSTAPGTGLDLTIFFK